MKKILNTLLISAIAISFNVDASTFTTLTGSSGDEYYTGIVSDGEITAQSCTVDCDFLGGLSIDPIIAYTFLNNSGDSTEIDWMTAVLDELVTTGSIIDYDPITSIEKIEFDTDADVDAYWTDLGLGNDAVDERYYTGDLDYGTEYYLLKAGQGNLTYDTFLYENAESLFQATIDLTWLEGFSELTGPTFDIYRVSHISAVPVPAAAWLFGTALLGFVGFARRRSV
ncbi:MAG: VPLPA-CTERM sorting domain-containing protein [Gammaproteobacteria bacterium]|nr:VPLPA-CTERM sorting domain-containing protein [Gammaproteobacteria bacterium]